jgi:cytochrome oxidase Cu insertion factor (SCO1/SenC/PrrC family)
MATSTVKYWVILVCLLGAGYASFVLWRQTNGQAQASSGNAVPVRQSPTGTSAAVDPASGPVADFVLTDSADQEFDSKSLHGKVWVASFFFTNCPAVCWRMNQALSAYQQTHPDDPAHFVSITCDPANDTPEALAKYAEHFKADPQRWTFLTGDIKAIQAVGQDSFKISVVEKDHTDRACVVDRKGQVRGRFRLTEPDQLEMLERLLAVVEAEKPEADEPEASGSESEPAGDAKAEGAAAGSLP